MAYDKYHLNWTTLLALDTKLRSLRPRHNLIESLSKDISGVMTGLETFQGGNFHTASWVADWLRKSRSRGAKESLDKLYAVRALFPDNVKEMIHADYSPASLAQPWKAYLDFAKQYILIDTDLDLLTLAPSQSRPAELPSWCPNPAVPGCMKASATFWTNRQPWRDEHERRAKRFSAGMIPYRGNSAPKPLVKLSSSNNLLSIAGFRVDRIECVASLTKKIRVKAPYIKLKFARYIAAEIKDKNRNLLAPFITRKIR